MSSENRQSSSAGDARSASAGPQQLRELIRRADQFAAAGDARSASAFYLAAVRAAAASDGLPGDLAADVRRAQAACAGYAAQYRSYLREKLAEAGFHPQRSSPRFAQSVDIALGERRIFVQEPRYFYFPGLPQIQFYPDDCFPWLAEVEAATDAIRGELLAVLEEPDAFTPYVTGDANRPQRDHQGMLNNPAWSAFYLWKNGSPVPGNAERCPQTMHALRNAPLSLTPNRSPSVLFSLLRPGAHIPPHNGLVNTRLICHLPLIVPGKTRFRVGNEVREWVEGRAWAFDDTIEHEAWNDSTGTRVILLFDVWRPELNAEERRLVSSLFEAIDAYNGSRPDWSN
jgi:aspartyl/asparaginyl beta-hydroxylase (cupin superfamily)